MRKSVDTLTISVYGVCMTNEQRIEIGNKLVAAINAYSGEKGRVWSKCRMVRVYLRKGFVEITEAGEVDVATVGGIAMTEGVAMRAMESGLNVVATNGINLDKLAKNLS